MLVATNGTEAYPVRLVHWWPGRQFLGCGRAIFFEMAARARGGSRYITLASVFIDASLMQGAAYCCPKDTPSRARGREIALGRLEKELRDLGYWLE